MRKKLLSVVLVLLLSISIFAVSPISSEASSYPIAFSHTPSTAILGTTVKIKFTIFNEYHNEKIHVAIYDSNDELAASADHSFYNSDSDSGISYYTVTWNTADGYKAGKYKVVYWMEFYTMCDWHEAPNSHTDYITLKKKPKNVPFIKSATNIKGQKIKVSWTSIAKATKYQVAIGGNKYNTKKTVYTSKKLTKGKKYNVKVRVYKNKKWSKWSGTRKVKINK